MGLVSKPVSGGVLDLDWPQGSLKAVEEEEGALRAAAAQPKRQRQDAAPPPLRCPRCDSGKTKFCYYNNYSRSQPRHFCKACRRHWTEGGTLRNVPVGGGRKGKRPKLSHHPPMAAADGVTTAVSIEQQEEEQEQLQLLPTPVLPTSDFLDSSSVFMGSLLPFPLAPPASTMSGGDLCTSFFPEEEMTTMGGSLAPVAAPWQMWLPSVSGAESSLNANYWNCWDELTGFESLDLAHLNKV